MAKKVNLNFKLEKIDKEKFENVCKELGVSTNTAYIILINKMIRENRLPWSICPMVPIFTCSLLLSNFAFAIDISS